jgi:hypothetical protein
MLVESMPSVTLKQSFDRDFILGGSHRDFHTSHQLATDSNYIRVPMGTTGILLTGLSTTLFDSTPMFSMPARFLERPMNMTSLGHRSTLKGYPLSHETRFISHLRQKRMFQPFRPVVSCHSLPTLGGWNCVAQKAVPANCGPCRRSLLLLGIALPLLERSGASRAAETLGESPDVILWDSPV